MPKKITAAMLYNLVQCPHRVTMDLFADPVKRDRVSPFVQLLWDRGTLHEKEVISSLQQPFTDLSVFSEDEKERKTREAMERGDTLIYSGRVSFGDLVGEPDLLRKERGGYVAGDIKSGAGEEGGSEDEDGKPKIHYGVQLALYTDVLNNRGQSAGPRAFVWDIHGKEVAYDFSAPYGIRNPRTLWQDYQESLQEARNIVAKIETTLPAYGGECKNCVWYTTCHKRLNEADDLTLIPGLGRTKRDVMISRVPTVAALSAANPTDFVHKKKTEFKGVGLDSLSKFIGRAKLLNEKGPPYLRAPIQLPATAKELFFDIELDPMRDVCYLHGFIERTDRDNATEKFFAFFASDPTTEAEEKAFREAWAFIKASESASIFYYSPYERTHYKRLQRRYPSVCTESDIESLFASKTTVDLLNDVVRKATEWPTNDYSLKTLAKYLGFSWRDTHPSGAASIEWFDRWVTGRDPAVKQRIFDYNEDDCRATRVLLDGIKDLK